MANPAGHRQTGVVSAHNRAPGWFTRNVFNRAVAFSTRHGVSILGSRVLAVKGHASGARRTTRSTCSNTMDAATSYQCAVTVIGSAICGRQAPANCG